MSIPRFVLPAPLAQALGHLPAYPGSLLFACGLNAVVRSSLPADVQQSLDGKRLRIAVTDAGVAFDFRLQRGRFQACTRDGESDLTISATACDFLLLARREEDPDTLFFSRRLVMEGDTELGLLVKNTLDAIELPVFELGRRAPAFLMNRLKAGARR